MPHRGQVFDDGTIRMEFQVTSADSNGELHEMRVTYAPDSPLPPAHLHPAQEERFEVQEGAPTFTVDGEERTIEAGDAITIAPGAVHQVRNAGDAPAVVIWQTRPALRTGEFFETVGTARATGDIPALLAALEEYGDVFRIAEQPSA